MAWSISDLFPPWGDSGERPPDNFQYNGGDQVNEKHFDYMWSQLASMEDEIRSALTDIDSDGDGVVDKADTAASGFSFDGGATLSGDLSDDNSNTIWNYSLGHIPDSALEDPRTDVSDGGTLVVSDVTDINFGTDISASDDGDGTVTINSTAVDSHIDVSEYGDTVETNIDVLDFEGLQVSSISSTEAKVSAKKAAMVSSRLTRRTQ